MINPLWIIYSNFNLYKEKTWPSSSRGPIALFLFLYLEYRQQLVVEGPNLINRNLMPLCLMLCINHLSTTAEHLNFGEKRLTTLW